MKEIIFVFIENSIGLVALTCALGLILPNSRMMTATDSTLKEIKGLAFMELILAIAGKLVPIWGLTIGIIGLLDKSLQVKDFEESEVENFNRRLFYLALVCEVISLIFGIFNK